MGRLGRTASVTMLTSTDTVPVRLTRDEIEVTVLALERAREHGLTAPRRATTSTQAETKLYDALRRWTR